MIKREDDSLVYRLIELLKVSNDSKERGSILRELRDIGGDRVYESLLDLQDTIHGELRYEVLDVLTKVHPSRSQYLLIKHLNDQDSDMRLVSSSLLLNVATVDILDALIRALNHPDVNVRTNIVIVLGKLGDLRALPALQYARDHDAGKTDDGYTVRWLAERAIQNIENQAGGEK
jgi:HEAT repeat protein